MSNVQPQGAPPMLQPTPAPEPQQDPYQYDGPGVSCKVRYRRVVQRGDGDEGVEVEIECTGYDAIDAARAYAKAKVFETLGITYTVGQDGSVTEQAPATPAQQVAAAFPPAQVAPQYQPNEQPFVAPQAQLPMMPQPAQPPAQYVQQPAPQGYQQPAPQQGVSQGYAPGPAVDFGAVKVQVRNHNQMQEGLPAWLGQRLVEEGYQGFVEVYDNRPKIASGEHRPNAAPFRTVDGKSIWEARRARQ